MIIGAVLLVAALFFVFVFLVPVKTGAGLFKPDTTYKLPDAPPPDKLLEFTHNGQKYVQNPDIINVLLLGVDELPGSAEGEFHQADTLILFSLDKKTGAIDMLPIPRDIVTPVMHYDVVGEYAYTAQEFICTAHSFGQNRVMGGQLTEASVSYFLYGIPIHRFFSVSIGAISHATDYLGGVPVTVPADFQQVSGLAEGETLVLNGEMAEIFVRTRSLPEMDRTNVSRMSRQQEFLQSLVNIVKEKASESPFFLYDFYREMKPYMATDLGVRELLYISEKGLAGMNNINAHQMEGVLEADVEVSGKTAEFMFVPDDAYIRQYLAEVHFRPAA